MKVHKLNENVPESLRRFAELISARASIYARNSVVIRDMREGEYKKRGLKRVNEEGKMLE